MPIENLKFKPIKLKAAFSAFLYLLSLSRDYVLYTERASILQTFLSGGKALNELEN